jgi:uncharacterized protein YdhG (YjbR/CyaY superfamily)
LPAGQTWATVEAISRKETPMPTDNKKAEGEAELLTAISAMEEPDRAIAEKLHALIKAAAPELTCRTWYGMPAYTNGSKIVCWFRSRKKFGERYMTLGFNDIAKLDDGNVWPISYALVNLTAEDETKIAALVEQAVS